ncbi:MAG: gliding motility-associated ABC transporter substrate-binding protein GldG [Flavobacteriaceae bacterium]|nr:MAG: gliding motility-associated ABC transporter substrate-binding protein GldG [Flavobacteriaceae bacterium]
MIQKNIVSILKAVVVLVVINILASYVYTRFDLTEDKRYSLTQPAINSVANFTSPVIIDVLLDGNLPPEFAKLKLETAHILEEFVSKNKYIKYSFVNPLEDASQIETTIAELQNIGLTPANITVENSNKVSQEILFPWAMVTYKNTTVKVALLKNKLGATSEERVNISVQHLEYSFADAFSKVSLTEKKRVAVIKGNGELDDIYMADYLTAIREYYNIGAITLDSVASNPERVLNQLQNFDLAIIAKPTEAFTDAEKYVLDQYLVNGGKSMWLIDQVAIELDSLFNENGSTMAFPRDLNLTDFFFKYGVRINPVLVNDMYATQIVLATGEANNSQYNPVPWNYNPMVFSRNNHPININLEALRLQFANTIDTLPNSNKKTVLYWSSPLSKVDGAPKEINLNVIGGQQDKEQYNNGNKPLAVLIEGEFNSAFTNRVKPFQLNNAIENGPANKMLVVADGDIIKNQTRNGRPLDLGYDKWTNNFYGNKEFLLNSINYLLDDDGLINIRNKKVSIPLLDQEKIINQKSKWQLINIGVPILITLLFGMLFSFIRKKRYGA